MVVALGVNVLVGVVGTLVLTTASMMILYPAKDLVSLLELLISIHWSDRSQTPSPFQSIQSTVSVIG